MSKPQTTILAALMLLFSFPALAEIKTSDGDATDYHVCSLSDPNATHCSGFRFDNISADGAPYIADEPVTIRCNGKDDGANWHMAQAIATKYKTLVKIGPNCLVKPDGKFAGMVTSAIVIDGTEFKP